MIEFSRQSSDQDDASLLTVVMPTRNRPHNLPGQIRLLQSVPYPVIVADSSDPESARATRSTVPPAFQYRKYSSEWSLYDKLAAVLGTVETPFVLVISDRKITLPHAIPPLLSYLRRNPDHAVAQGYILGYEIHEDVVDINRVIWFTPTIGENEPLQRHYHLMRRYQSWAFAVFRTDILSKALKQARQVNGPVFQEVLLMNSLALQGKLARLPMVLSLQSDERSFHPPRRNDPFFWFLDDINSFFLHYLSYRRALTQLIFELGISMLPQSELNQLVDMVHAVWLHRNFDDGVLNHAARLLLGDPIRPIPHPFVPIGWREPTAGDMEVRRRQRYLWRREVLAAEPRGEIHIRTEEIDRVSEQLDVYFSD